MKFLTSVCFCFATCVLAVQPQSLVRVARQAGTYYNSSTSVVGSASLTTISFLDRSSKSDDSGVSTITTYSVPTTFLTANTSLACIPNSTVTFTGSVYPTVYVTVNSTYNVLVNASDVSLSNAPTIFVTPGGGCMTTIVSPPAINGGLQTETELPVPNLTFGTLGTISVPTLGLRLTTTVVITKKTPVPYYQVPVSTNPPVTFVLGTAAIDSQIPSLVQSFDTTSPDIPGGSTPNIAPTPAETGVSSKLGQIINSIINSPFATPGPVSSAPVMTPAVTTIDGVPITINSPNVIIGGEVLTIPTATQDQATAVVNGQTFTVLSNQIIAPSTTYNFIPSSDINQAKVAASATITQTASTVTANGVIFTIEPTQAIISGKTYAIGSGVSPTTLTVDGQTISVGANGIGFPSTTYAPPATIIGDKYELVVISGLTISVASTDAIISGTTFKIGSNAPATTVTLGENTITLGPSGVVLASTTIHPTSIPVTGTISAGVITTTATPTPTKTAGGKLQSSQASRFGILDFTTLSLRWVIYFGVPFVLHAYFRL